MSLFVFLKVSSPPGEVRLVVISVTISSISLSWSVASGTVDHWEVVWMENDRNKTSGRFNVTYYTIYELKTNTSYSITVRATNVIGTTESNTIIFNVSTTYTSASPLFSALRCSTTKIDAKCSNTDNVIVIGVGGVALLLALMLALSVTVFAILGLMKKCQANLPASAQNRYLQRTILHFNQFAHIFFLKRNDVLDLSAGEVTASDGIYYEEVTASDGIYE